MAIIFGALLLTLAEAFMLYVLGKFHGEARRAAKSSCVPRPTNVVPFRTLADVRRRVAPGAVASQRPVESAGAYSPAGLRRMASKRAATRS